MENTSELPGTLSDAAWNATSVHRSVILVVSGSLLLAFLAQVQIPLRPVPITGQTLGVLLVGALLGSRLGALSVLLYLTYGVIGLPVFAGASAGPQHILGPTGGYLVGFVPAAFALGWLSERGWDRGVLTTVLAMLIGTAFLYLPGILWLSRFIGWDQSISVGLVPFILGDAMKIALASVLLPLGWSLIGSERAYFTWPWR